MKEYISKTARVHGSRRGDGCPVALGAFLLGRRCPVEEPGIVVKGAFSGRPAHREGPRRKSATARRVKHNIEGG